MVKSMNTEASPLDYNATINRMEPGIAPVDYALSMASIAMSLKRIADALEKINADQVKGRDYPTTSASIIASAINSHSTKIHIPHT